MRKPKEKPVIRQFFIDPDNSPDKVIMQQYDKRTVLYLKLASEENRKRKIGVITKSTKTIKIVRNREKHFFKKGFAYGFNEYILRTGTSFDKVWLKDDYSEWKIPVEFILKKENGFYLSYSRKGFELQKFIALHEIEQFEVKKEEKRRF